MRRWNNTLCAYAVPPGAIPDEARRLLPRYPLISATLIGRLVVASPRQRAAEFYVAHGFIRLPESMRLVLPMQTVERLFAEGHGLSKWSR